MYVPEYLVDYKIRGFTQWKVELEAEDIRECGAVVNRNEQQLRELYESYLRFQGSPEVTQKRAEIRQRMGRMVADKKLGLI